MKLAVRYRFRRNAERLRSHLARARFFRGHGVHSPFVYAIVRQVFMKTELAEGEAARREGATLCIMEPYADVERRNCCRHLTAEHPSTSIDNRGYLLLFNGTLPKQHFKL